MRGKASRVLVVCGRIGITPAYAGKSYCFVGIPTGLWDYPRVCGEKDGKDQKLTQLLGSPPRMRGKDAGCLVHHEKHRITPACAGKSLPPCRACGSCTDHPRVCGEKAQEEPRDRKIVGSPPRMRGKAHLVFRHFDGCGITPAYAGKRPSALSGNEKSGDHPRVCGEKCTACGVSPITVGSPPRVRGKAAYRASDFRQIGITPACAGKSEPSKVMQPLPGDHPRVCGEKLALIIM